MNVELSVEEVMVLVETMPWHEQFNTVADLLWQRPKDLLHPAVQKWITANASAASAYGKGYEFARR
jgi:hypothetical protein